LITSFDYIQISRNTAQTYIDDHISTKKRKLSWWRKIFLSLRYQYVDKHHQQPQMLNT